jgi:hypothetical protein
MDYIFWAECGVAAACSRQTVYCHSLSLPIQLGLASSDE